MIRGANELDRRLTGRTDNSWLLMQPVADGTREERRRERGAKRGERKKKEERERGRENRGVGCLGGGRLGGGRDAASWQLSHQPLMNELARAEPPTLPTPLAN